MRPKIRHLAHARDSERGAIDNPQVDANNTRLFGAGAPNLTETRTVANIKSAQKRARQAAKTRNHNMVLRSKMRTHIKAVIAAVDKGDKDAAAEAYKAAVPVIDSMITKGIVNKNKAARHKSRLNKMVKSLAA